MHASLIPVENYIALAVFGACWLGYTLFYGRLITDKPSLLSMLYVYRQQWMREMQRREGRIVDTSAIANLMQPCTFFASTTILILGGVMALLAAPDGLITAIADLPFADKQTVRLLWEFKIFSLIVLFAYAFFKFTWAMRQYSTCTVLVVSAPPKESEADDYAAHIEAAARVASLAGESFNMGVRAYYFSLAAMCWFLNAWAFMLASVWITYVVYRREFRSPLLNELVVARNKMGAKGDPRTSGH
jgi:uncharacterized membrane protein